MRGKILGGWQVNGIFSAYSGTPFTVTASSSSLNAPGQSQTADQIKPVVTKLGGIGSSSPYYDPTAFAPVTQVRYGTTGRNILRGPGLVNVDASLFRNFRIPSAGQAQLRGESYNVSNTPHFNNPSAQYFVGRIHDDHQRVEPLQQCRRRRAAVPRGVEAQFLSFRSAAPRHTSVYRCAPCTKPRVFVFSL